MLEVPGQLVWCQGIPVITMRRTENSYAREPFWHQTLKKCGPPTRLLTLDNAPDSQSQPAGFIFHMMRCGSTLIGRMLQATQRIHVISEPLAVQDLLARPEGTPEQRRLWLRRLVGLYPGRPVVIKLSSGCTRYIREIQASFSDVPCIFVYREPSEILHSCMQGPPLGWRRATPRDFAPHLQPEEGEDFACRMARYLGSVCYFAACGESLKPWSYEGLAENVLSSLSSLFGLDLSAGELEQMRETARFYSKDETGLSLFDAGAERERRPRSPVLDELAERFVLPELKALLRVKSSR